LYLKKSLMKCLKKLEQKPLVMMVNINWRNKLCLLELYKNFILMVVLNI
jgi:hypothetical protein